ncbi:MAG: AAA family ATPase [Acidobacteriota bacterium]
MASPNLAAPSVATFPRLTTQAALPPACRRLDPNRSTDELRPLEEILERRVKGQNPALAALLSALARPLSGLKDPHRPHLSALLLGPTGIGKTETAKAVAEGLLGNEAHLVRVNCESFAHSHEVAKLLGSPPGYVGQNVEPLLSQGRLDAGHLSLLDNGDVPPLVERMSGGKDDRVSVILFDEIEKADPVLWTTLLGVLEDGILTLGDNTTSSFQSSVIFVTSNVGGREMAHLLEKPPLGFAPADGEAELDLAGAAVQAAQDTFPLELINRFDEVIVYSALDRTDLETILDKFLAELHDRAVKQADVPLLLRLSAESREHILATGTDPRFGARPLRRAVERLLVDPLSRLIASRQLAAGDVVEIELEEGALAFYRQGDATVHHVVA